MSEVRWVLLDANGAEVGESPAFSSQADAETWMGSEWSSLLEAGAEEVSLRAGSEELYRMGLREA